MALCVALNPDGTLEPTGQAVADCTGYVLLTPAEHAWAELLAQAFAYPTVEEATQLFVGGFGGVLSFYVVARIFGAVISMFD